MFSSSGKRGGVKIVTSTVKKKNARRGLRIDDNGFDFVIFFVEFLAHNGIACRKYKIFNASEPQYGKYNRVYGK